MNSCYTMSLPYALYIALFPVRMQSPLEQLYNGGEVAVALLAVTLTTHLMLYIYLGSIPTMGILLTFTTKHVIFNLPQDQIQAGKDGWTR